MAAGTTIQLKRKAGAFVGGDLAAGEAGVDTTNGDLYFSTDGATVVQIDASVVAGAPYVELDPDGTTPAANEIAFWTRATGIGGNSNFTISGFTLGAPYLFASSGAIHLNALASPSITSDGWIMVDHSVTDWSHGLLQYYSGEKMGVVAMPDAEFTSPTDGQVVTYNATNDEFELTTPAGSGDVAKVGTPVDNQLGVWTGDGTIEGDASLTFDTTTDTLAIGASGNLAFGAVTVIADSAGTTTLQNIDALDATTEGTIEAAIDTLSNLTSVGTITTGTWQGTPIAQAYIADDSISLAKLAHGTDGELITWDATGAPAAVAAGTSGHVLTSNGAGAAPTFQAAAGGGGSSTETFASVRNESGATITKGSPVYFDSYDATDTENLIELASSSATSTANVVGLVAADITNNTTDADGVQTFGPLSGLDTSAFAFGDPVYVSPTAGELQNYPGTYSKRIGFVAYSHASSGIIFIQPEGNVWELGSNIIAGTPKRLYEKTYDAAVSEIIVEDLDFDYWHRFEIEFTNVNPVNDNVQCRATFRSAGSDITGAYGAGSGYNGLTPSLAGNSNLNGTDYAIVANSVGSQTGEGQRWMRFEVYPHCGEFNFTRVTQHSVQQTGVANNYYLDGAFALDTATEADGVKVYFATGNIQAGAVVRVTAYK